VFDGIALWDCFWCVLVLVIQGWTLFGVGVCCCVCGGVLVVGVGAVFVVREMLLLFGWVLGIWGDELWGGLARCRVVWVVVLFGVSWVVVG